MGFGWLADISLWQYTGLLLCNLIPRAEYWVLQTIQYFFDSDHVFFDLMDPAFSAAQHLHARSKCDIQLVILCIIITEVPLQDSSYAITENTTHWFP